MRNDIYLFFTIILMMCALVFVSDAHIEEQKRFTDISVRDFPVPIPDYEVRLPDPEEEKEIPSILDKMEGCEITVTVMRKESLGWYFITAYCPYECGYNGENFPTGWMTASGEICHMSSEEDRYTIPSTCAIDRSIHGFYEQFYIEEFGLFVAEDTGLAVKGKHLDLFYDDESVEGFPTGYYEVFSVEYEEVTITLGGQYDFDNM